jgi:phosphate acetyltransferase
VGLSCVICFTSRGPRTGKPTRAQQQAGTRVCPFTRLGDACRVTASATSIYIASPEGDTGKSTIALGILHRLAATVARVGVFRPITRRPPDSTDGGGDDRDYILEMLLDHTTAGLSYDDCVGVSYQRLHEDPDGAIADIVDRFHRVADACDAVVIVGSDYTDVATPSELSVNARIAVNLGAPVVLAIRAKDRSPQEVVQVVEVCLAELAAQHAHTAAVVANRCAPADLDQVAAALAGLGPDAPKTYVLPEEPLLVAPSVAELQRAVGGTLIAGDAALVSREALGVLVAGMTAEHVLERLTEGVAVITPSDRSDVVLAVVSAHAAEGFPSLSCLILNGGLPLHPAVAALVDGLGLRLPIVATEHGTYETARRVASTRGRVTVGAQRKIDTALNLIDAHVDTADLLDQLSIPIPTVTTPQMFTYQLLDRARSDRRRIVLPEGEDDRILRAAGRLLQRGVADLTILGDEAQVRSRAAELGVDLSSSEVIDPRTSDLCDRFAEQYAQLRKHKGITVEQAREIISDVSYFGTMLVHNDMVDGMVSGATHTTAHTVRPAFEIIKTLPDVSTVSSIFLMCLADRVLAYGDCAIVPDPTAEQLADIAISSARTAAQFGIDPRVAMLSYSTGTSGSGADVDKVRAATELVREREPELLVEGPIQYDAAVEPSVAATKMPDSPVAGQATVLIFPDLNTGNNTYKAVQRSAGAIAIGPVLQGLNKPVNDLSRGALVEDIVNTVAITAIQAQGK